MIVGGLQRGHVALTQLADISQTAAAPRERFAAEALDQHIGHQARVAASASLSYQTQIVFFAIACPFAFTVAQSRAMQPS